MFFITGDIHGDHDIHKFSANRFTIRVHRPADELVLVLPYILHQLIQLTEDNLCQYTGADIMGGAFVRIVCIG